MALALKEDEVKDLKAQKKKALKEIWEIIGHPGDTLNKVKLFNIYINKEVVITMPKVIAILYGFHKKMEAILGEIRKLVPGSVGESSQPPVPPQKETPHKEKPLEEVKTPLPQRPSKGTVEEGSGEVPPPEFPVPKSQLVPEVTLETKVGKTKSPMPSPWKLSLRKQKEPTPEYEELGDTTEETGSSEGGAESEEEEPSTPKPEQQKGVGTRSLSKKKPPPIYRSPYASKRQSKTPGKGEGFNKKPRGK